MLSRAPRPSARRASHAACAVRPSPPRWRALHPSPPAPWSPRPLPSCPSPLGLRHRLLPPGHRLARLLPRSCVGACPLSAHRQALAVPQSAVAPDLLEALDVQRDLAAQIALDREAAVDDLADLRDLRLGEVAHADRSVDARLLEHGGRCRRTDAEDVAQRNVDALLPRDINASDPCHLAQS